MDLEKILIAAALLGGGYLLWRKTRSPGNLPAGVTPVPDVQSGTSPGPAPSVYTQGTGSVRVNVTPPAGGSAPNGSVFGVPMTLASAPIGAKVERVVQATGARVNLLPKAAQSLTLSPVKMKLTTGVPAAGPAKPVKGQALTGKLKPVGM